MNLEFKWLSQPLPRNYIKTSDRRGLVTFGDVSVEVPHNPFWQKFALGWEPETERVYQNLVKPGSTVVDIGAWIGSTLLFAMACGANKVIALEPNPESHTAINKMNWQHSNRESSIHLINKALSDQVQTVSMGVIEGENDTSTSGLAGNQFTVQTTTWPQLVKDYSLDKIDLIKIDIEGAEALLSEALQEMAERKNQAVHLSIHVPTFPADADIDAFIRSIENFSIYDDRGEALTHKNFANRILSDKTHPDWGTQHGNYFELLLIAK